MIGLYGRCRLGTMTSDVQNSNCALSMAKRAVITDVGISHRTRSISE
jgi:hypothetical protein